MQVNTPDANRLAWLEEKLEATRLENDKLKARLKAAQTELNLFRVDVRRAKDELERAKAKMARWKKRGRCDG